MRLIEELAIDLGLGVPELLRLAASAPKRYKVYTIPKRRGGTRVIAQPSYELKYVQRYILEHKLSKLPVHAAATGYVPGKNILENAEAHRRNAAILKMDFQNFFPSLLVADWTTFAIARGSDVIDLRDLNYYSQFLFWGGGKNKPISLSIGAPTSPTLSNILMHGLDSQFVAAARKLDVAYTRYADDITASAKRVEQLLSFETAVREIVSKSPSPRLRFNEEKRGLFLRGQRRMVTGLVVTPQGHISIGRERKRLISTLLHRASLGQLEGEKLARLKGLLGFCIANEPDFVGRMRTKYGDEVVTRVLRFHIPKKGAPAALQS